MIRPRAWLAAACASLVLLALLAVVDNRHGVSITQPVTGTEPPPVVLRAESVSTSQPAPAPSHCDDWGAMEAGRGHPVNQDWHNHLDARGYARPLIACTMGWGSDQWACLDALWQHESGWNHHARNRYSGATGVPQSLPGHKMASQGDDWRTNPRTQVRWGVWDYIGPRYGTPCAAWGHFQRRGWY